MVSDDGVAPDEAAAVSRTCMILSSEINARHGLLPAIEMIAAM
jgi:hypothetical protein